MEPVGKTVDPIGGRIVRIVATKFRQIVREAATSDTQHALFPQRRQSASDKKMVLGSEMGLDRELKNVNVGLRIPHEQWHPGAVIQAAASIDVTIETGCA